MIISLEGIDASGKTTVAKRLCTLDTRYRLLSRREPATESEYVKKIAGLLHEILWESGDSRDVSANFWIYLQAAWHSLLGESSFGDECCIIDGWYYKFHARLNAIGYNLDALKQIYQLVPQPDHVMLLDVDPAIAWTRKSFRPTEMGLHDMQYKLTELGMASFVEYQSKSRKVLLELASQFGWHVIKPDREQDLDHVVNAVHNVLLSVTG